MGGNDSVTSGLPSAQKQTLDDESHGDAAAVSKPNFLKRKADSDDDEDDDHDGESASHRFDVKTMPREKNFTGMLARVKIDDDEDFFAKHCKQTVQIVIKQHNRENGTDLELVKVIKANREGNAFYDATFEARNRTSGDLNIYQTSVFRCCLVESDDIEVENFRLKETGDRQAGQPDAPEGLHEQVLGFSPALRSLRYTADWLEKQHKILLGFYRHRKYRRYVDLKLQNIFNSLVDLYTNIFKTHWVVLRRMVDAHYDNLRQEPVPQRVLARAYISAWFIDLYVANRSACKRVCPEAYNEYYTQDLVTRFPKYDNFLTILTRFIRPTSVHLTHEDTLFIPKFGDPNYEHEQQNIFGIDGWYLNNPMIYSLIQVAEDKKLFTLSLPPEVGFGRPFWLFDWHDDNTCYAWFPTESNFELCDVAVAYILGVACTPKLAPRDVDEWQNFPGNVFPQNLDINWTHRTRGVSYHGSVEVDTMGTRSGRIPNEIQQLARVYIHSDQPDIPPCRVPAAQGAVPEAQPAARGRGRRARAAAGRGRGTLRSKVTRPGAGGSNTVTVFEPTMPTQEEKEAGEIAQQPQQPPTAGEQGGEHAGGQVIYRTTFELPEICQYRIITYVYHHYVTQNVDEPSRDVALRQIIKGDMMFI